MTWGMLILDTRRQTRCLLVICCLPQMSIPASVINVSILAIEEINKGHRVDQLAHEVKTKRPGDQSITKASTPEDFKRRSNAASQIYWIEPNQNGTEKSGPVRSHIMRAFHRQRPRKVGFNLKGQHLRSIVPKGPMPSLKHLKLEL